MAPTTRSTNVPKEVTYCICPYPDDYDDMVECSGPANTCPGNNWFHLSCVALTEAPAGPYYCAACAQRDVSSDGLTSIQATSMTDSIISGEGSSQGDHTVIISTPTDSSDPDDDDEDDDGDAVECIFNHHVFEEHNMRLFLVKWVDCSWEDSTWFLESKLKRCSHMVAEYCRAHQLEPTTLPMRGGKGERQDGSSTGVARKSLFNYNNWVETDEVIKQIHQYTNLKSYHITGNNPLTIKHFHFIDDVRQLLSTAQDDHLIILLHKEHFFILLLSTENMAVYGCDSTNYSHSDHLSELVRSPLPNSFNYKQLIFEPTGSIGIDHCGSAAAAIALEMIRIRNQGAECLKSTSLIKPSKSIMANIISRLHKNPSKPMNEWKPIQSKQQLVCDSCNAFKTWKRLSLLNHQRKCRQ